MTPAGLLVFCVIVVTDAVDWTTSYNDYNACVSWSNSPSGVQKYAEMTAVFNLSILPPCSTTCQNSPNAATSYNHFCTVSREFAVESQVGLRVVWGCQAIEDVSTQGCEWSLDSSPNAVITFTVYVTILRVLMAQYFKLPPAEVNCEAKLFQPNDSPFTLTELFLARADDSSNIQSEIPPLSVGNSTGYLVVMACRIDTYRLALGDIIPRLGSLLNNLGLTLMGDIYSHTNANQPPVTALSDSDYTLYWKYSCCDWNSEIVTPVTTTSSPTTAIPTSSTTVGPPSSGSTTTTSVAPPQTETTTEFPTEQPATTTAFPVVLGEDVNQRNKTIIVVVSVAGGLAVFGFIAFMLYSRWFKDSLEVVTDSGDIRKEEKDAPSNSTEDNYSLIHNTASVPSEDPRSMASMAGTFVRARNDGNRLTRDVAESEVGKPLPVIVEVESVASADPVADAPMPSNPPIDNNQLAPIPSSLELTTRGKILIELQSAVSQDVEFKKSLFQSLCRKWHPDKHSPNERKEVTEIFQFVQEQKSWFFSTDKL